MTKSMELRQEKAEKVKEMRAILDKCDDEKRQMNITESATYKKLDREADALTERISAEERLSGIEGEQRKIVNPLPPFIFGSGKSQDTPEARGGFESLGEMVYAMSELKRNNKPNDRLMALLVESREQQMGSGNTGGFAIPPAFRDTLLLAVSQAGIIRPRATVIPAGSPADVQMSIPALDQTTGGNMFGGVTLVHTGEGMTMTETTAKLREINFEPKEISGYIVVTNKLLANWSAASAVLDRLLMGAMAAQEDYDFLRGSGVNMALGIINSPAAILVGRNTASDVKFADIYGMVARMKMGGSPIWIASQTIIPSLATLVDSGNHAIWLGGNGTASASQQMPSTLFGYPLYFSDRMPSLGTKGDLCLIDPSYYVIKDGSGPFLTWSEHVWWTSNKTGVKIVWNVDGKAWLTEPLQLEGDISKTISPFVILS
jgi:HK97 family phage major capsid protein